MIISIMVFGVFYYGLIVYSDSKNTIATSILLNWLYLIVFISISITLIFTVIQFVFKWKDNPKSIIQPLIWGIMLGLFFGSGYLLGDGTILNISGYEGVENTYHWLKLTDMWMYTIYLLLSITFIAVLTGIIWSYLKKNR
jgi:hypothetical protein